tara:strand:- start:72 stop:1241 length:1170 start_codon:yes stop_codon:yes gene_type:complete
MKNITVIGAGYVGLSLALLLSKNNSVSVLDIDESRVRDINQKKSYLDDVDIHKMYKDNNLNIVSEKYDANSLKDAEFFILALPTNFNEELGSFDVSILKSCISDILEQTSESPIIIKSTVPIGFSNNCNDEFNTDRIFFSPEFLREGRSIHDNIFPSRIIIGGNGDSRLNLFKKCLKEIAENNPAILETGNSEAEAIKLFSNTYLSVRIGFFNEIDSFAIKNNLDASQIITSIGLDPRIGSTYNNPSFGFGGYCLPKDSKQAVTHFKNVPNTIISSIPESNLKRKEFIARDIISRKPNIIGVYRLVMKGGSDNFRESASIDVINKLLEFDQKIIIYEPLISQDNFEGIPVIDDIEEFKKVSNLIIANRNELEISDISDKVYTRDIFGDN